MLMQSKWYLTSIDPYGTHPTANVFKGVEKKVMLYYYLVVTKVDEGQYGFNAGLELY